MNQAEVLSLFEEQGAVRRGHFILSSGRHSDTYLQSALVLQWPGIAERLGHEIGTRLAPLEPTVVVGPALGGVVIAHETARQLGVRMIFTERMQGAMQIRRGFELVRTDRAVVVEDVITTGGSQREVIDLVGSSGAEIVGVAAIIDRSPGASFGVPLEALLKLDAATWDAGDCPLCSSGQAAESPGSRQVAR